MALKEIENMESASDRVLELLTSLYDEIRLSEERSDERGSGDSSLF
jgi:hypothetical protein